MSDIQISTITSVAPEYEEVFTLRDEVLRKPLGMSLKNDDLSRDHYNTIFIARHEGAVVGCVLLHPLSSETAQLRAMAVYNAWQGKGVGRKLVEALEDHCWKNGYGRIVLHSRKVAMGFYSALGYTVTGNEFTEVGIPHFLMEKNKP
jgi:N-acetylglutamate synthase-like GNAT family acetyltransferase